MSIGNSLHGVDLEILVRTYRRNSLNWTPGAKAGFGIVEPLVGHVFDVPVVNVGDARSQLAAVNTTAEAGHLETNFCVDILMVLFVKQLVVDAVASAHTFNIIDNVSVGCSDCNTAVVHLASENLVSEEVISKEAAVGVWEVVAV